MHDPFKSRTGPGLVFNYGKIIPDWFGNGRLRFKHYTVNVFVEELKKVNFSNYECFSCIDTAYTDFLNKSMKVANEIAPSKEIRIKNNTQEWSDREIAELIHAHKKLFLELVSKLPPSPNIFTESKIASY